MSEILQPTFALVHGSWHDGWCMNLLQDELEDQGYRTIVPELPTEDPTKSFDEYAEQLADEFEAEESVIGVFHSRAGNYGPRAVNLLQARNTGLRVVQKMIFLAPSFENATTAALGRPAVGEAVPVRNSLTSRSAIIPRPDLGTDMSELDLADANELLYHDVEEADLVKTALRHLRPQNRPRIETVMQTWPDVPQELIVCEDDRMVRPEWSRYVATNWLGIKPVSMEGGHSPFLSRPHELAKLLIELTLKLPAQRQAQATGCKA